MTRAAIFDLDDTLYSHDEFVASGFAAIGEYVASLRDADVVEVCGLLWRFRDGPERGRELQALCAAFELSPTLVPRLLHVFRAHRPTLSLAHGAVDTLRELRARGWRLGILTNGLSAVQRRKVRALAVEALVDTVVYAEEHAAGGKPAVTAFDAAAHALGVAHARAVMVGNDVECDIRGAERAGLHAIRVHAASYRRVAPADALGAADLIDVPALAEHLIPATRADVH